MLDKDQEQPIDLLTYHLKFRFYFQPYEPETETSPASHQNLIRFYFQTEAWAGEYDVPKVSSTSHLSSLYEPNCSSGKVFKNKKVIFKTRIGNVLL